MITRSGRGLRAIGANEILVGVEDSGAFTTCWPLRRELANKARPSFIDCIRYHNGQFPALTK